MWREFKAQHKTDDTGNVASSRQHTPPDGELAHQQTSQDGICSESSPIATTKAAEVTAPSTATSHKNNQSRHLNSTTPGCEVMGGNPISQAEGAAFTAWLEDNDPYLAWLTTNKLGLSHRSSRGPRPSQLRTIPTLSPFSTWDLETSTQAQPKVKPREDDDFNIRKDIIVDGGAGTFSSPHRKYFLPHTLRPTKVTLAGIDNQSRPADLEGIAQVCFPDSKQRIIWRVTTPGVLTETAMPDGYTLLSLSQLRASDGIGNITPSDPDESPYLYTGSIHSPSRCAYIREVSEGLLSITPLSPRRIQAHLEAGYIIHDLTSQPASVIEGQTRCQPVLAMSRTLLASARHGVRSLPDKGGLNLHKTQTARRAFSVPTRTKAPAIKSPLHVKERRRRRNNYRGQAKAAARIFAETKAEEERQRLIRILPGKHRQVQRIHAVTGHGSGRTLERIINHTTGHGLSPGDSRHLMHCLTCARAHQPHRAGRGPRKQPAPEVHKTQQQLHSDDGTHKDLESHRRRRKSPSTIADPRLTPGRRPWGGGVAAAGVKDPRERYEPFQTWAIDTITYPTKGVGDFKYALTCIETHTHYTYTFLMKHKSDAAWAMDQLRQRVAVEHNTRLRRLYMDGAKEFTISRRVAKWSARHHIKRDVSSPYLHWMQSAVENCNKQYRRITRALLKGAGHPHFMWPLAHAYAQHIINIRSGDRDNDLTPHERAFGEMPDISNWHVYGTPVTVKCQAADAVNKLDDQAELGIYLGPTHCNPNIAIDSPYSHLVSTEPGQGMRLSYSADLQFDTLWDLRPEVHRKFFCRPSGSSLEDEDASESTYVPSEGAWSITSTDTRKSNKFDSSYYETEDGRSIHQSAMAAAHERDEDPELAYERLSSATKRNKAHDKVGQPLAHASTAPSCRTPDAASATIHNQPAAPDDNEATIPPVDMAPAKKGGGKQPKLHNARPPKTGGGKSDKLPMQMINSFIRLNPRIIIQQDNPKSKGSKSRDHYETYKHATTMAHFLEIHPVPKKSKPDLQYDLTRRYILIDDAQLQQQVEAYLHGGEDAGHIAAFQGLVAPPIKLPGRRPIAALISPTVDGPVLEYHDDRFSVTAEVAELKQTEPHLQQAMLDAIVKEMESVLSMGTFRWAHKTTNARPISTRIVLKTKYKADGSFDKYKARLVVRGFMQKEGIDFYDTFTPTSEISTFRILAAEAAQSGWRIMHADVKNAFCNAVIDVPNTFITLPSGITFHDDNPGPNRGLQLVKALYGLKQAPRLWFKDLTSHLKSKGLTPCKRDTTLYKYNKDGQTTYVLIYVDDIVVTGPNAAHQEEVYNILTDKYTVDQWEELQSYLGISASRDDQGQMVLRMGAKIDDLVAEFPILPSKLNDRYCTPRKPQPNIWDGVLLDSLSTNEVYCLHNYMHIVGTINYQCTCIKPEIALAISKLAQHNIDPRPCDAKHCYQLVRYLRTKRDDGISFRRSDEIGLAVYSDSNFGDLDDPELRATSGTVVTYRSIPVAWRSKRQPTPTDSTHHAELLALHQSTKMALKFRYLLEEMGFTEKHLTPIYVDNEAVKFTAYHETIMEKNRHIKSKYFLIQGHVNKELSVIWLRGTHNPADMLTKPLPASEHRKHADLLLSGIEQATPPKPSGRGGVQEYNGPAGSPRLLDAAQSPQGIVPPGSYEPVQGSRI